MTITMSPPYPVSPFERATAYTAIPDQGPYQYHVGPAASGIVGSGMSNRLSQGAPQASDTLNSIQPSVDYSSASVFPDDHYSFGFQPDYLAALFSDRGFVVNGYT